MPSRQFIDTADHPGQREFADRIWDRIRGHLEDKRSRLGQEIRDYPQPIPACDAQFNHLTGQRSEIYGELGRLELARADSPAQGDCFGAIDDFIASSDDIDEQTEQEIRTDLKEAVSLA